MLMVVARNIFRVTRGVIMNAIIMAIITMISNFLFIMAAGAFMINDANRLCRWCKGHS